MRNLNEKTRRHRVNLLGIKSQTKTKSNHSNKDNFCFAETGGWPIFEIFRLLKCHVRRVSQISTIRPFFADMYNLHYSSMPKMVILLFCHIFCHVVDDGEGGEGYSIEYMKLQEDLSSNYANEKDKASILNVHGPI